jgi:hypothetical protein
MRNSEPPNPTSFLNNQWHNCIINIRSKNCRFYSDLYFCFYAVVFDLNLTIKEFMSIQTLDNKITIDNNKEGNI